MDCIRGLCCRDIPWDCDGEIMKKNNHNVAKVGVYPYFWPNIEISNCPKFPTALRVSKVEAAKYFLWFVLFWKDLVLLRLGLWLK